jgi:DHA1 family tetracycline resistance protein-like MFS transporter
MKNIQLARPTNIIGSFKSLKGNTRVSIMFEPLWGIPFVIFNFYLSLYMKELGITAREFGYLISIGFISGAIFSLFGGVITDKLGRKKTTFIFDLISWPFCVLIYLISNSFWMFAIATVINNAGKIVGTSFYLMVIEDATNDERIAAFNLLNIITISTGVIIPLAGILVNALGVVKAERFFLGFASISMTIMMLSRNHFYKETKIGQQILDEHRRNPVKNTFKNMLPLKALIVFKKRPIAIMTIFVCILFNLFITIGTINSLYFAPYMTEVLKISKSSVSILGGVYSGVMFLVLVFVFPLISKFNKITNMLAGLLLQTSALFLLIVIPTNNLIITVICVAIFALGFGTFKPYIDTLLAEVTEGKDRAGIYAIVNTLTCIVIALFGVISGNIFAFNPKLLYILAILILLACIFILACFFNRKNYV